MPRRVSSPLDRRVTSKFGGKRIRLKQKVVVGAALLLGGPVITTSLAATVTISGTGNTNAVEFGQGSQVAVACDTSINTAITEAWDTGTARFKVTAIVLTNLNLTDSHTALISDQGCGTKAIKIGLVGSSGMLTIGTTANTPAVVVIPTANTPAGTSPLSQGATGVGTSTTTDLLGGTAAVTGSTTTAATLTFTLPSSVNLDPANILRVSLESA